MFNLWREKGGFLPGLSSWGRWLSRVGWEVGCRLGGVEDGAGARVSTRIYPPVFCLEDQERLGLAGLPLLRQINVCGGKDSRGSPSPCHVTSQ